MILKKKDFQRLVNFIKEFKVKLPCNETSAELRDSLNLSLLHMHKYYKKARIRSHANGGNTLEGSLSLSMSLTGAASPVSPYIAPTDRFDWRWLSLDVDKLSASFGHGDKTNFVPEIFFVVKDCDLDQLKKMVDEDEDKVYELDAIGRTTPMYATNGGTSEYLECLKFLISKGADLQHQSSDGFTCLHIACFFGYKDFVATLLEAEVDVNAQDSDGRTPLHFAAAYCSQDILQMLVIRGADPNVQDNEGLTPAMWACHFDQLESLQLLLAIQEKSNPAPEARFEVVDNLGRTILHWAVTKTNNINCVKFLLNAETAQLCDDEGKTIFLFAAEHGCISACEEVFSLCSEDVLEDMDNFGRTALHLAALGGHGEVVEILLNRGATAERLDGKGVSPMDLVTSRKLNYCNLVFTSYQRYRERLASVQASLGGGMNGNGSNKNVQENDTVENAKVNETNEIEKDEKETKERRDVDDGSVKMDCQDAVGFEIEGDLDEDDDDKFDVFEADNVGKIEEKKNGTVEAKDGASKNVKEQNVNYGNEKRDGNKEEKEKKGTKKAVNGKNNDVVGGDVTGSKAIGGDVTASDVTSDQTEKDNGRKVEVKEDVEKQSVEEADLEAKDVPPEELEIEEASDEDDYDFEDVSIGIGDQKIVLVAHHEGDNGFQIDYGNDINDLEFQDEDEEDIAAKEGDMGEDDLPQSSDALKVGIDRDLSPKIESVTRLMETNTGAANQSVSVNMSVSSLRSDSEDEDAMPSGRERISKLDSKMPAFEDRPINQLEYRDPFAKAKPLLSHEDSDSHVKRNDDSRPKTGHGKRKDKKDGQKNRQLSPKGMQQQGLQGSPRLHLGALEPMKPLQPIIPATGIPQPRAMGGNHGSFPGMAHDSMKPSSPRSPLERNALSSPGDSPRSKGGQLPSSRTGMDAREAKLSHIPRPSSPSSRDRHLPMPTNNIFAPRPPIGR